MMEAINAKLVLIIMQALHMQDVLLQQNVELAFLVIRVPNNVHHVALDGQI